MAGTTQAGYYVWEVPGRPVAVHLSLEVADRILADVMRGFAAVPKRGAEVGGLLIGTIELGEPSVIKITDFEAVDCAYKRGPSYLLVDKDAEKFDETCSRREGESVGYYRSHTREGFSLSSEDIELMDRYFPNSTNIALLIRPFATKVSLAGFFAREDGVFPETTPLEFPFRRQELSGEDPPPRRPILERRPRQRATPEIPSYEPAIPALAPEPYQIPAPPKPRSRNAIWIPLSFVFLLLGVALGMMIALTRTSGSSRGDAQDFSLGLAISKTDDNLSVRWDRQSAAIHTAQRGVLEIEDGSYTKSVELDSAQLQNGSIIYRNSSGTVRFRLVVYPRARVSITETAEWKQ